MRAALLFPDRAGEHGALGWWAVPDGRDVVLELLNAGAMAYLRKGGPRRADLKDTPGVLKARGD